MVVTDAHVGIPKEVFFRFVSRKILVIQLVEIVRCRHDIP